MLSLTYYYSHQDNDQHETYNRLIMQCEENDLVFVDICIDSNEEVLKQYSGITPVILIGPYTLKNDFSDIELEVAIKSAIQRKDRLLEENDKSFQNKIKNGLFISNLDRFSYFFAKYYAIVLASILILFTGIPFLAPVLQKNGSIGAATLIYKVYHVICHQLDFRSFFLFGEQAFYPRELAAIDGVNSYESVMGIAQIDLEYSRNFVGNEIMGYKVALCERDVAIYLSMALFGTVFHFSRKKIKQIPWYLWIIIAVLPIAIDGISQIPSLSAGWPIWVPIRESTPFLRIITGTLFGFGTAWYMLPMMEESLSETRAALHRKFEIVEKYRHKKSGL